MKKGKIENWEGKIYDFLSPVNLTMFREERTEKVISFIKELLKSEEEKEKEKIENWDYYNKYGGGYLNRFLVRNPEFNTKEFIEFVITHNKGDRDSGELGDIAKHEILRLAYEFEEEKWRFPNVYGEPKE